MTNDERRRLEDDICIKRYEMDSYLRRKELKDRLRDETPSVQDQLVTTDYAQTAMRFNGSDEAGSRHLFYEENYYTATGSLFERTYANVILAEYMLNRDFSQREVVLLNDFYELLGLQHTEYGDTVGWEMYSMFVNFGNNWIDFEHPIIKLDDGLEVMEIRFIIEPQDNWQA